MKRILLVCGMLLGSLSCSAQAGSVSGEWRGIWTDPTGYVFTVMMTLDTGPGCKTCAPAGDGSIQGKIVWTLRKMPANATPELAAKVGMTGTELVKGEGLLVLNGYQKDDPNSIIGLDQYRLAISDDGKVIGGITLNYGPWTGQLFAVRAQS
ncbi:MAG: hypothetical protein ACLQGT_11920 [Terracidiphilus sp.]